MVRCAHIATVHRMTTRAVMLLIFVTVISATDPLLSNRAGIYPFNMSKDAAAPVPSDVCRFRWQSGVNFIAQRHDANGNLAKHGGLRAAEPPTGTSKRIPFRSRRGLLVVHIGKTAGSSLLKILRAAGIPHDDVHLFAVRRGAIMTHDDIIISIRDPLDRTISAFNWDNPWSKSGRARRREFSNFYATFPDMNAYASNLTEDTALGALARQSEGHISMDTCYYVGGVLADLKARPLKRVFVVDTATFDQDVRAINDALGWGITFSSFLPHINKANRDSDTSTLLPENRIKLKHFLAYIGEYEIYNELRSFQTT